MRYKKIRLDFKYCERGRFFRTILVEENINLVKLGCAIVAAFNGTFEHFFTFDKGRTQYAPRSFGQWGTYGMQFMEDYTLEVLGDSFTFTYDMGDNWEFKAKVYKKVYELDNEDEEVMLIDGAGQGIWEDNIYSLVEYLDGNISPDSSENDEEEGIFLPWNFENETFGDFDTAFDLDFEKEDFYGNYQSGIYTFIERDESSIEYPEDLDSCFGEEIDEEDIELLDELEEIEAFERLHEHLLTAVDEQISSLDYVEETYIRLSETHSEEEAKEMIAAVLFEEMTRVMIEESEFDEEAYINSLNELE